MGNLDSLRDWGHARDYVEMQWRMLQQDGPPEEFVIATGRQESVRRFIKAPSTREIVFVRGTTEGINLIAQSWGRRTVGPGDEIVQLVRRWGVGVYIG